MSQVVSQSVYLLMTFLKHCIATSLLPTSTRLRSRPVLCATSRRSLDYCNYSCCRCSLLLQPTAAASVISTSRIGSGFWVMSLNARDTLSFIGVNSDEGVIRILASRYICKYGLIRSVVGVHFETNERMHNFVRFSVYYYDKMLKFLILLVSYDLFL